MTPKFPEMSPSVSGKIITGMAEFISNQQVTSQTCKPLPMSNASRGSMFLGMCFKI